MKVQLSATIDAELSVKLSKRIKQSEMSKSAYIQQLIENDLGLEKSDVSDMIKVSPKISEKRLKERLVMEVIKTAKQDRVVSPPHRIPISKLEVDSEYYYPFGKLETSYEAVSISTIFADDRLSSVRKTELEEILNKFNMVGLIYQPKKDYFRIT
jgi:hypothetical protein